MNRLSFVSFAVLAFILVLDKTNANPYFKANANREQNVYDENKDEEDRTAADEINIVFGVPDTDEQQPSESERSRHRERQPKRTGRFKQPRDRRQSWSTWDQGFSNFQEPLYGAPNLSFKPANQDIYAGFYDAYVPAQANNLARSFTPYPSQNPFQNIPSPQYVLPSAAPSVVNNYFIAFPISSEPWRVGSPWFSSPFFFVPFCPPNQAVPTPEPTTPTVSPTLPPVDNGTDLSNKFGEDDKDNNGSDNNNKVTLNRPSYRPVESPIDLTPAKPRHPLSRPPPPVDHSGGYDQASSNSPNNAANNAPPRRPQSNRRPAAPEKDFESNRISTPLPASFPVRTSIPQETTTPQAPRPQVNAPSSCVLAITFCCVPNAPASYSRNCLENLGCAGIFWDRSICNRDVVRAANNAVSLYRQRTFQ